MVVSFFCTTFVWNIFCDNNYLVMHVTNEMCTELQQYLCKECYFYLILIKNGMA
jgi:hypothetical protein